MTRNSDIWIVSSESQCQKMRDCSFDCRMADAIGDVTGRCVKLFVQNDTYPVDTQVLAVIDSTASKVETEYELPARPVIAAQQPEQTAANGHDVGQSPEQSSTPEPTESVQETLQEPAQDAAESSQSLTLESALPVDLDQTRQFLTLLDSTAKAFSFQRYDDDKARVAARKARNAEHKLRGEPKEPDPLARVLHGRLDDCAGRLLRGNKEGAGVFVTVNKTDGQGRKARNIVRVRAVFADLDGVSLKKALQAAALMPHIIAESSRGRWWLFWLVDGLPLDQFRSVQLSIAVKLGSDQSVIDLPRVARLPGFLHQKDKTFLSRIVYPKPGDPVRAPYSAEKILSIFLPVEKRATVKKTTAGVTGKATIPLGLDSEQVTNEIIADLRDALAFLPADDAVESGNRGLSNKLWSDKAYQLKTLNEPGRALFHEYSRKSGFYDEDACDEIFDRAEPTRTSYKAIFAEAQGTGWENPRRRNAEGTADAGSPASVNIGTAMERLSTDPGAVFEPDVLDELKKLRANEYATFARLRAQIKDSKKISMSEFDKLTKPTDDGAAEAASITFREIEPCADPVDGAALLKELASLFTMHAKLPRLAEVVLALWTLLTYLADAADLLPILALGSPEKGCGKTTLLALLTKLVWRPLPAASVSPAALFRVIEQAQPSLLIDEVDSFLKSNEEMRGLLDSGHTRAAAFVLRAVEINKQWTVRQFSTFGPKVLSGIGRLPGTIEDRSLIVTLQRKRAGETVKRLRYKDRMDDVCSQCLRWGIDHKGSIFDAEPALPDFLQNRAGDNWSPLFSIARAVGDGWPELVVEAANEFSGADQAADSGAGVDLLRDIRAAFEDAKRPLPGRVSTRDVIASLVGIEDGRWRDYSRGKDITPRQLAALLRPFLIKPKSIRPDDEKPCKGYTRDQFDDAFARYLPSHAVTT